MRNPTLDRMADEALHQINVKAQEAITELARLDALRTVQQEKLDSAKAQAKDVQEYLDQVTAEPDGEAQDGAGEEPDLPQ